MKHIALAIGHGPNIDKGAENSDGTTELNWNRDLAILIQDALSNKLKVTIINRQIEKVQPVAQVNETGADFTVELHCNAFNGLASGTEMIHYPSSLKAKQLAQMMQEEVVAVLQLSDRGVKGPQAGGRGMAFLQKTRMPAVIAETMFIDNNRDLRVANNKKRELAEAYARAFVRFAD